MARLLVASTLTDLAVFIPAVCVGAATLLTAVGSVVLLFRSTKTLAAKMEEVHEEVKTGNGQRLGELADIAEGRAAEGIAPGDRTEAEQHHVEMKQATEAAAGLPAAPTTKEHP